MSHLSPKGEAVTLQAPPSAAGPPNLPTTPLPSAPTTRIEKEAPPQLASELDVLRAIWDKPPEQVELAPLKEAVGSVYNKMKGKGRMREQARAEFFSSEEWKALIKTALEQQKVSEVATAAKDEAAARVAAWKEDAAIRILTGAVLNMICCRWLVLQRKSLARLVKLVPELRREDALTPGWRTSLNALNLLTWLVSCDSEGESHQAVRDAGAIEVAKPFLQSPGPEGGDYGTDFATPADWRMSSTLLLAFLLGASEAKQDQALLNDGGVVRAVLDGVVTGSAGNMEADQTTFLGAMCKLAVIDSNKHVVRDAKALPVLVDMVKPTKSDLFLVFLGRLLLHLTFDVQSKQELQASKLSSRVQTLLKKREANPTKDESNEVKKVFGDLLWALGNNGATQVEKKATMAEEQVQVMLSYNWHSQAIVLKIAEALRARGFRIWLDIEQMAGSTIEAMAEAVEGSKVVVLAFEPKYKESPNCRLEAEYAFAQRKALVPALMAAQYRADGWLGALLGSKLWHDFTNQNKFSQAIDGLCKDIQKAVGLTDRPSSISSSSSSVSPPVLSPLLTWSKEEIITWLRGPAGLSDRTFSLFTSQDMLDGQVLCQLHKEWPLYHGVLEARLEFPSLGKLLAFKAALDKVA
eukprot:gb/GEZN01003172.1/.p1 GENE.gb/GEZN01003172.1/~~gb/GEZN01003172.1/.p1  ORF type:complete len:636 (-),score=129.63 gb/GEZN01003172.1/:243-2150(-)